MHYCHLVIKSVIGIQVRLESSDFRLLLKSTILSSQDCVDVANFRTYLHMSLVQCVGTDVVQQIVANGHSNYISGQKNNARIYPVGVHHI